MLKFLEKFTNNKPLIEVWANRNASRCTPDQIIVANIIERMAKDFRDGKGSSWIISDRPIRDDFYGYSSHMDATESWYKEYRLSLLKTSGINTVIKSDDMTIAYRQNGGKRDLFHVKGVPIEGGSAIVSAFDRLKERQKALDAAAAKAKKTMEDNEKKWQLAESLLGMVRNEFGALVPKEEAG